MRVRLFLLALLVLAAPAMAHGVGQPALTPLRPMAAEIGPEGGVAWAVQSESGDVPRGDLMLFTVEVFQAPVAVSLWADTTPVRTWELDPGVHHVGRIASQDAVWGLDVNATSKAQVRVTWDRPCDCPAKAVTPEVTGLAAGFTYTATEDGTWHALVPEPPLQKWRVAAYRPAPGGLAYPDDFERVARSEAPGATSGGRPAHELSWPAVAGQTTYLVVTSREADVDGYLRAGAVAGREQSMAVPQVDLRSDADAPGLPLMALVGAVAAVALRRR